MKRRARHRTVAGAADINDADRARSEIAELVTASCRALYHADEALLSSFFHPDSVVESGTFTGTGAEFASEICGILRVAFDQTFHTIVNQSIEVEGDTATSESYLVTVSTITDRDEGKSEILSGGRYCDQLERRGGTWKFTRRTFVSEWTRFDRTASFDEPPASPNWH